ncbi:MAG: hypothetical protein H6737_03205 [Alphaproteobacteria bacterium]|nr:hypothetical protein [Alphaproteobacteria bacterium]
MPTWLHDEDTLRSLADESGPVGSWARLQRLGRGLPTALPTSRHTVAPMLALLPDGLDAWMRDALGPEHLWSVDMATELGLAPATPGAWTPALEALLGGENGRHAANALVRLGAFTRTHLRTVLAADRDDEVLVAWVLASTPPDALDETARQIAEGLRIDMEDGSPRLLRALDLLTPGHPATWVDDPEEAVAMGAALAGVTADAPSVRGSTRRKTSALAEILSEGRRSPTAALLRALARLEKAPALHPAALCALAWEAYFEPSGDPVVDVVERGARGPAALRAARMAVRAGADAPMAPEEVGQKALILEKLRESPALAGPLLPEPPLGSADGVLRTAIALRCPDAVPALLDRAETRYIGIPLASFAPTEEVLTRLLALPVPADPTLRFELAGALVHSGDRAALPNVKALLGHLEPGDVSEIQALARSIFNEDL